MEVNQRQSSDNGPINEFEQMEVNQRQSSDNNPNNADRVPLVSTDVDRDQNESTTMKFAFVLSIIIILKVRYYSQQD